MKSRALAFVLVAAATLLQRSSLEATMPKTGGYPRHGGILREDDSCPGVSYALYDVCSQQRLVYLDFHRMKGIHRFTNEAVLIFGPQEPIACPQPVVDAKFIYGAVEGPGPCPGASQ
ncbi:MAG TPA: hypothetical protein VFQ07_07670 [Candidatus Polarisedimenticolia bacterium]|nr:hypothetical protein [Candidatus Polarisedimenticolia bacterium]